MHRACSCGQGQNDPWLHGRYILGTDKVGQTLLSGSSWNRICSMIGEGHNIMKLYIKNTWPFSDLSLGKASWWDSHSCQVLEKLSRNTPGKDEGRRKPCGGSSQYRGKAVGSPKSWEEASHCVWRIESVCVGGDEYREADRTVERCKTLRQQEACSEQSLNISEEQWWTFRGVGKLMFECWFQTGLISLTLRIFHCKGERVIFTPQGYDEYTVK